MLQRTAKSCGPDAPTLASSSRMLCRPNRVQMQCKFANDGGKRARSPRRARRKPLKPLRAGMPGDSGVLVVTRVRSTTIIAHETAGALGIRHSPRPLSGGRFLARLGCSAPRDGLLRGACHRARIRATRWLAMTLLWFWIRLHPRDAMRPRRCFYLPPKEGVGNAGCPLHPRSRVHLVAVERTRVTTSTPESPGIPARNGFTTYFVLSSVTGLFCHRRLRNMRLVRARLGRLSLPQT